jgi:phage gp37-like protein
VGGDIEVQNATTVMGQHQKHVKNLEADRRHREEINGESAGINRSEVGDERALRERSNEPLGPEFGVVVAVRQPTKHKTGA